MAMKYLTGLLFDTLYQRCQSITRLRKGIQPRTNEPVGAYQITERNLATLTARERVRFRSTVGCELMTGNGRC
jgi:hypothetical protein